MRLMKLEIRNIRGLPDIRLEPDGKNYVIWGPNGAGKSGVVDAIEFVLTGRIGRLTGEGTEGITLAKYGVHIDHKPDAASVTADFQIEGSGEPVTISRKISSPGILNCPEWAKPVFANVEQVVRRGQIVLTRRDILRYIAAKAGTRAQEIQELLNLSEIHDIRQSLVQARNKLRQTEKGAKTAVQGAEADINVTLQSNQFSEANLLEVVNVHRYTLGGIPIATSKSESLKINLIPPTAIGSPQAVFNLSTFVLALENIRRGLDRDAQEKVATADENLRELLSDAMNQHETLAELERLELITQGLKLVDDETIECPLCGASWLPGHLKQHLQEKVLTARKARELQASIANAAEAVKAPLRNNSASISSVVDAASKSNLAKALANDIVVLGSWNDRVKALLKTLDEPIHRYLQSGLSSDNVKRLLSPENLKEILSRLGEEAKRQAPEMTPEQNAWDILTKLEANVGALERRNQQRENAALYRKRGEVLLEGFEDARDTVLSELNERISSRFAEFYRKLHPHEGGHFNASMRSEGASLDFEVDFYGRGTHPPQALHSEGHQDSMGLCLFLALNEELSKDHINLVVLDDVMMSVDSGHRRDACSLISEIFPDRQFVITTHDKTWANQLRQRRIVAPENLREFTGWTLESGPQIHQNVEFWDEIAKDLGRENVRDAAFKLRRQSEEFFESVCDALVAELKYNSAHEWELGDWASAAMDRLKGLINRALLSAKSWGNDEIGNQLQEKESIRKQVHGRTFVEQWAINAAVHYNNWENFSREDSEPVVEAFRDLYGLFTCAICGGMLEVLPRKGKPELVKCSCSSVNWNLEVKAP